jgi:rubrerythrin
MAEQDSIDIIKGAILLEHRGQALYQSVAGQTEVAAIKELFGMLAEEEAKHIAILNTQYSRLAKGENFDVSRLPAADPEVVDDILSKDIVKGISAAGYEAAVISAALDFERSAVNFYSKRAEEAESTEEKQLYQWLTDWEKGHMIIFSKIDQEIKEQVWYDNSFWPQ